VTLLSPIDAVKTLALPGRAVIDGAAPRDRGLHALHKDADPRSVSVTPR
jgi:hypothetical protein